MTMSSNNSVVVMLFIRRISVPLKSITTLAPTALVSPFNGSRMNAIAFPLASAEEIWIVSRRIGRQSPKVVASPDYVHLQTRGY